MIVSHSKLDVYKRSLDVDPVSSTMLGTRMNKIGFIDLYYYLDLFMSPL